MSPHERCVKCTMKLRLPLCATFCWTRILSHYINWDEWHLNFREKGHFKRKKFSFSKQNCSNIIFNLKNKIKMYIASIQQNTIFFYTSQLSKFNSLVGKNPVFCLYVYTSWNCLIYIALNVNVFTFSTFPLSKRQKLYITRLRSFKSVTVFKGSPTFWKLRANS